MLFLVGLASCAQYAVLYAGSNGFWNYRHQADIFTIYGQLLNRGFTANNIALYAYDDIATDPGNPFTGKVFLIIRQTFTLVQQQSMLKVIMLTHKPCMMQSPSFQLQAKIMFSFIMITMVVQVSSELQEWKKLKLIN